MSGGVWKEGELGSWYEEGNWSDVASGERKEIVVGGECGDAGNWRGANSVGGNTI